MIYLFWTGGYDSTFRLCEIAVKLKKEVQPIYISDPDLDNKSNKKTKRKNKKQELKSISKITQLLNTNFSFVKNKNLVKPIIIINNCKYDEEIKENMKLLKKQRMVRREQCQYGGMAQVCKNMDLDIEMCAEIGGFFEKRIRKYIKCKFDRCRVIDNNNGLHIFERFILPTINLTKQDMYNEAKEYGFHKILENTWSCWYPRNNKPCNKCDMCRHRLKILKPDIEHFQNMNNTKKNNNDYRLKTYYIIFITFFLFYNLI